jgi:opacity protein-like surface antigen
VSKSKDDCQLLLKHVLVAVLSLMGSALAAPLDIGTTVAVTNTVTLESGPNKQPLLKGAAVHQDEVIVTGIDAKAELELLDRTKLAVGPEARLVLDKFVYDPNASSASISLNVSKGAFRFLTGLAQKDSYEIRTPVAFVGTRGTVFDVYVGRGGDTAVLLLQGAIEVCTLSGVCRFQDKIGSIIIVSVDGVISQYSGCRSSFIQQIGFQTAFPFIAKRPLIDPIRRMILVDFECVPPRRPPIIKALGESQSPLPAAGITGLSSREVLAWPGLYIGINRGAGWSRSSELAAMLFDLQIDAFVALSSKFDSKGGFWGGNIGYDWQRERIIYGIEADLQRGDINGSKQLTRTGSFATANTRLDWFGTVRGRLGYTFDNALLYATGGFAFGGVEDKLTLVNFIPLSNAANKTQTAVGYTVGAGLEYFLDFAWSANVEYQYIGLGSDALFMSLISGETATARFAHSYDTVRVGLRYHMAADDEPLR